METSGNPGYLGRQGQVAKTEEKTTVTLWKRGESQVYDGTPDIWKPWDLDAVTFVTEGLEMI